MPWKITKEDIRFISLGARILSCGGGGNTRSIEALILSVMKDDDVIEVIPIHEVKDDWWVTAIGIMGSTVLFNEDLPTGEEVETALSLYEKEYNKNVDALISIEIGGVNALAPLLLALKRHLPVIDGDGMGRAFPELYMTTLHLNGIPLAPLSLVTQENMKFIPSSNTSDQAVDEAKSFAKNNGGHSHLVGYGASGDEIKTSMLSGTLYLAYRLGKIIASYGDGMTRLRQIMNAFENSIYGELSFVIKGYVTEVSRWFENEGIVGKLFIESYTKQHNQKIEIQFMNEFFFIHNGENIYRVPDLIVFLHIDSLEPISVVDIQKAQSVIVLVIPAPNILHTTDMLTLIHMKESYQLLKKEEDQ
ncbi:DUF917 domain-containing protein [Cytobacillus sp. FSL R5-0569]|uniref:DUF917 domain-containing protein n=1 Tax=Cytobacillus sp. FSL R5-0569 TaxID=2921649 RepID=UPI0030F7F481